MNIPGRETICKRTLGLFVSLLFESQSGTLACNGAVFSDCSERIVGELDKGESGPFPGAVYELRVIHAGLPLGWRARCTILELESSNEQRTNRAEEL